MDIDMRYITLRQQRSVLFQHQQTKRVEYIGVGLGQHDAQHSVQI